MEQTKSNGQMALTIKADHGLGCYRLESARGTTSEVRRVNLPRELKQCFPGLRDMFVHATAAEPTKAIVPLDPLWWMAEKPGEEAVIDQYVRVAKSSAGEWVRL